MQLAIDTNPRLSTKAIILVAILLFVQLVSTLVQSHLQATAEDQTLRVQRSREIANEASLVAKLTYDGCNSLYCYMQSTAPEWADRYLKAEKAIPQHLKTLKILVKDRPAEKKIAMSFMRHAAGSLKVLKLVKEQIDRGSNEQAALIGSSLQGLESPLNLMASDLEKITALEDQDSILIEKAAESRAILRNLTYATLIINALVVIALLIVFNRGTVKRLKILLENTKRFGQAKELLPALKGKDEIAELDAVFHEMADAARKAALREKELMDMKKQIVAMVSHDLRSPLTAMQTTLALLQKGSYGEISTTAQEKLASTEKSSIMLIKMINDLLDIEKLESGAMELAKQELPLPVLVERAVETVKELALIKTITIDYDENEVFVLADGDRLIQVIVNLLSNAIKFSPEGSSIKINSKVLLSHTEINSDSENKTKGRDSSERTIQLEICDSGPGIPEKDRELIFQRFRQIEDSKEHKREGGSGLGLAISKILVEQMDGKIGVKPGSLRGSTFFIQLQASGDQNSG